MTHSISAPETDKVPYSNDNNENSAQPDAQCVTEPKPDPAVDLPHTPYSL